jgi:hypothetical protein
VKAPLFLLAAAAALLSGAAWRAVSEPLASPAAAGSAEPNLTVAPDGRIYMSWLEPADSGHALRFAILNGRSWSQPRTVRTGRDFFVNWADFPSIEVLANGVLAAHWLQKTGGGTYAYGVRVSLSRDGGVSWSEPVTPHRDTADAEHGFVAQWRERDGTGLVWLDGRKFSKNEHDASNEMMLLTTTVGADGTLGEERVIDARTCDCCQNSAAMTSGGPIVAYRDRTPGEIRDIYVTRRVEGRWTTGAPVYNDGWKIEACPVNGPAIAAARKRVAVAWFTAANDRQQVKLAFSNDGGAHFAAPLRIDDGNPAGRVDVGLLGDGSALVSWIERTGGDTAAIRVRRARPGRRPSAPVTIALSSAARASGFPQMAITRTHAVFAWTVVGKPSAIRVARVPLAQFK